MRKIKTHCESGHVMHRSGDTWKCNGMVNKMTYVNGKLQYSFDKDGNKIKEKCNRSKSWNYVEPAQEKTLKNAFGIK